MEMLDLSREICRDKTHLTSVPPINPWKNAFKYTWLFQPTRNLNLMFDTVLSTT